MNIDAILDNVGRMAAMTRADAEKLLAELVVTMLADAPPFPPPKPTMTTPEQASVPDGFVLVPKVPTGAMVAEILTWSPGKWLNGEGFLPGDAIKVYTAMLAASPAAQAREG